MLGGLGRVDYLEVKCGRFFFYNDVMNMSCFLFTCEELHHSKKAVPVGLRMKMQGFVHTMSMSVHTRNTCVPCFRHSLVLICCFLMSKDLVRI